MPITVSCGVCGEAVTRPPRSLRRSKSGLLFCNKECRAEYRRGLPLVERVTVACATCGAPVEVAPYLTQKVKKHFCSDECKDNYCLIDVACQKCGKVVTRVRREVEQMTVGPACSHACFGALLRENGVYNGEGNPAWNGGYSSPDYGSNWKHQRKQARKRDDDTCQDCGVTEQEWGYALDVHHIIPFEKFDDPKEANRLKNLVTLCRTCHMARHDEMKKVD